MSTQQQRSFYDQQRAFPFSKATRDPDVVHVVMANVDEDGVHGEWSMQWHDLGDRTVARLMAFSDAWEAIGHVRLMERLADHGPGLTPEGYGHMLVALGFADRTEELRGPNPTPCCRHCGGVQPLA